MKDFQFILEAGVNHDGDYSKAIKLIHEAAKSGADYVKFQTYTADKIAAKHSPSYWDLKEESTNSQIELFSKYDGFTTTQYFNLSLEANKCGIGFMTTCFDTKWVDELDEILPQYKVASADITNFGLLTHIARKGKPIILSTGAATFSEISDAIEIILDTKKVEIALLHCVLNYPTSAENASLGRIRELKLKFPGFKIGFSDHTKPADSAQAIQIAYDFGARIFEKHFTLTPDEKGNDHYHSFETSQAKNMVQQLEKSAKLIDYDEQTFISSQAPARQFARRGRYAASNLLVGEIITEKSLLPLRPPIGENGFGGEEYFEIIGMRITQEIAQGDPILRKSLE